ncbi:Trm112 family protein [Actinomycetota bacterium]
MTNDGTLVPPELLAIMQCPACTGDLAERPDPPALVCRACGRAYPVRDGIPVMLVDGTEGAE